MLVYRISREKYAKQLFASGISNRWNKDNEFVIYTATSASLAALELLVHRKNIRPSFKYKLLTISIKEDKEIEKTRMNTFPNNWRSFTAYPFCQSLGSKWYLSQKRLCLQVPSAVLPKENNIVINSKHPSFAKKVKIKAVEDFIWDARLFQ